MSTPAPEQEPAGTRYEIVFTASGAVGKGDGPDALEVPEKDEL